MNNKINAVLIFVVFMLIVMSNACILRDREPDTEPQREEITGESVKMPEGKIFETGVASWYGDDFNGKRTSSGEIYDMDKLTAAHQTLPFNTILVVENLENNKKVMVRVNDRGPFLKNRIIDLSRKAAKLIGIYDVGTTNVRLRIVKMPKNASIDQLQTSNPPAPVLQEEIKTPPMVPQSSRPAPKNLIIQKKYVAQAGAFSSQRNAERTLDEIKKAIPSFSSIFRVEYKDGFYKIVSVEFESLDEALQLKKILAERNFVSIIH
jgi:rare lipoprotein A